MNGWTITKVWIIDKKLVVAPTIEKAIAVFKSYMGKDYMDEPKSIKAIDNDEYWHDYNALVGLDTIDMNYLQSWYQSSIDETKEPIWTDKHLEELFNDFYLIPKKNNYDRIH